MFAFYIARYFKPTFTQGVIFSTLLFHLVFVSSICAQHHFSNPYLLNHRNGLPNNSVFTIEQDSEGFIWVGTADGLCRYDGSVVKVFKNIPNDSNSVSNNHIGGLFYDDSSEKLWVSTYFGLNAYDGRTGKFKRYMHDPGDPNSLADNRLNTAMYKDRQGDLWIGVRNNGIACYDPISDDFEKHTYQLTGKEEGERLNFINKVNVIRQDFRNDSILWLGSSSGLLKFNKYNSKFKRIYFQRDELAKNSKWNTFHYMYVHKDGSLYLGTYSNGVHIFHPENKTFQHIDPFNQSAGNPSYSCRIYNITEKSDGKLWVTTSLGLVSYDTREHLIVDEWRNDPAANYTYGVSFIDDKLRYWARSGKGVTVHDPLNKQFQHYSNTLETVDLSPMKVLQVPEGENLYVSIAGGKGLYLLNRTTGAWKLIPPPKTYLKEKQQFKGRGLLYLVDGGLLQIEEKTLYMLSADGNSLVPFEFQPNAKGVRFMWAVQDKTGDIWITTVNGGVFRFNIKSGVTKNYQKELLGNDWVGQNSIAISVIYEDRQNNIWIKVNRGYSVYHFDRDTFYNFPLDKGTANLFNEITGFSEDNEGNILISGTTGTFHYGIGVADPKYPERGIIRLLETPIDFTFSSGPMSRDAGGNLWVHDSKKLIKLNFRERSVETYDGYDGLTSKKDEPETIQLNEISLLPTGEIALCHNRWNGISIFYPDSLKKNLELPKPYLVSFSVFDKELQTDSSLYFSKNITLPYHQNFFSFEFSAISLTQGHKNQYKYKLKGLDPDWIYPTKGRRYANYSNVREGEYAFQLMATNSDGLWNGQGYNLTIKVLPPWYRSYWAYAGYVLLMLAAAFVVYRFLKRRWALKMELEIEHRETLRLKELDAFKTRLYTNITHEFRTPLTVISGMADQLREDPKRWLNEGGEMIKRNSNNLLRLVNQMLDLRKLESCTMQATMVQGDVVLYLKYLLESFHSLAEAMNVKLFFHSEVDELVMDHDPDKLQQIVANLLSNAIKFTKEEGEVGLMAIYKHSSSKHLLIKVSDTGIGIVQEQLPFVFDRFFQIDGTDFQQWEGTGIGLALTKELVKLLGGEITVESTVGIGSEFSVTLPITNQALLAGSQPVSLILNSALHFEEAYDTPTEKKNLPLVLIIEDNADVVQYLKICLGTDYELVIATNGREGTEKAIECIPDLIVSDVMMPEKNGFEVCQTLKADERTSHIPVILLTAKADTESKLKGLEKGADAYLAKPFNKQELLVRTRKLLELRKNLQQYYRSFVAFETPSPVSKKEFFEESAENAFVQKVKNIVEAHIDEADFDMPQLCREVAMSRSQLHRKLTALTGLSPSRFIRHIRLAKAKTMLLGTEEPVVTVAFDTGFSDPNYFSRVFTKEFGVSPSSFRENSTN